MGKGERDRRGVLLARRTRNALVMIYERSNFGLRCIDFAFAVRAIAPYEIPRKYAEMASYGLVLFTRGGDECSSRGVL